MPNNSQSCLVSILMLTYNRAPYIGEAIASVLAQTYTNFELIVIDDGSTDDTASVVQGFTDSRIRYIKNDTNRGLAVRRSESLTYAQGKYVAILDSDDIWCSTDKLAKQVEVLENNPNCAVVGTFITIINSDGEEVTKTTYQVTDTDIRNNILVRNQFAHSSVLMRKAVLDKTPGYSSLAVAEDFELFLQLGLLGTFANLPEYLTKYRVHGIGESANKHRIVSYVLQVIKLHKDHYPKYCKAWLKFTLYRLFLKLKTAIN
jgi:glycosyltransferase involved in cell wall biosynthesis